MKAWTTILAASSVMDLTTVMFVHPTQPVEIFGNDSTPLGTLATR